MIFNELKMFPEYMNIHSLAIQDVVHRVDKDFLFISIKNWLVLKEYALFPEEYSMRV